MRKHALWAAFLSALWLMVGGTARAELPDIRNSILVVSGTVLLGGTFIVTTYQDDEDFAALPFQIVADPAHPADPTRIQVETLFPAPTTPCNASLPPRLTLKGTYNRTTGAFQVSGSLPGTTALDTGERDTPGYLLGNNQEIWIQVTDLAVTLTGTVTLENGRIRIAGSDTLPKKGGPSTNLTVKKVSASWVPFGDCNIAHASRTVAISKPYGGMSWQATQTYVSGVVTLPEVVDSKQPIDFEFRPAEGPRFIRAVTLADDGSFTILNVLPGTYDIGVKGVKWLRKVVPTVDVTSGSATGVNAELPAGDIYEDNSVDIFDFSELALVFDTEKGDGIYNDLADLNCDGFVDIFDFSLLAFNFDTEGDE